MHTGVSGFVIMPLHLGGLGSGEDWASHRANVRGEVVKTHSLLVCNQVKSGDELFSIDLPCPLGFNLGKYQVDVGASQVLVKESAVFGKFRQCLTLHFVLPIGETKENLFQSACWVT